MKKNKKKFSLKKLLLTAGGVLLALILIAGSAVWVLWGNEIRTVLSFKQIAERNDEHLDGSVYEMTVAGDYYFDDFLAQGGASTDGELIEFITGNLTKGLIDIGITPPDVACSSFTATLESGDRVFARNYDYSKTNTAIVYTNPGGDRHASVSTIDLQFLGIDVDKDVTSLIDKITCLAAPYIPFDGMNDAGVSCGIYMTYQGPEESISTNQDSEKPDITSTTMLRLILDYADSVDEAVELVSNYDLHDSATSSYHYMVADSTGKSAILEWVAGNDSTDIEGSARELKVTYNDADPRCTDKTWQCITNFVVAPDYYDNNEDMKGMDRYEHLHKTLTAAKGVMADETAAMDLLAQVGRRTWKNDDKNGCTVHSVVYNLTDQTALWVPNEHFGEDEYKMELKIRK